MALPLSLSAPRFVPGRFVELPGRGTTFIRELPGPGGAPVLVLLHGWTATGALNWHSAMHALAADFRVIAIDHRGHGRGLRSPRPFTLEDCADDVAALCSVLGIERAVLAGYSMGGPIAQLVWRRHRALVEGLVLCSTAAAFRARLPLLTPIRLLGHGMTLLPDALFRRWSVPLVGRVPHLRMVDELSRSDTRALCQAGAAIATFDSRRWVHRIDVPAAVVITTRDELVPARDQEALAAAIPGATVERVEAEHLAAAVSARSWVPALRRACADVAERGSAGIPAAPVPTATLLPLARARRRSQPSTAGAARRRAAG